MSESILTSSGFIYTDDNGWEWSGNVTTVQVSRRRVDVIVRDDVSECQSHQVLLFKTANDAVAAAAKLVEVYQSSCPDTGGVI